MKVGTRVVVRGLDAFRGLTGTLIGRDSILRGGGLYVVKLDDGREIRTSAVRKLKEKAP